MKLSVSLSEDDVAFLDALVAQGSSPTRSAAVHEAVALLRDRSLGDDYELAWDEWEESGDAALWDATSADGLAITGPVVPRPHTPVPNPGSSTRATR